MKKEKLSNIEFVRSVCAIIIIYFHFIAETGFVYGDDKYNILRYPCNGNWGALCCNLFYYIRWNVIFEL